MTIRVSVCDVIASLFINYLVGCISYRPPHNFVKIAFIILFIRWAVYRTDHLIISLELPLLFIYQVGCISYRPPYNFVRIAFIYQVGCIYCTDHIIISLELPLFIRWAVYRTDHLRIVSPGSMPVGYFGFSSVTPPPHHILVCALTATFLDGLLAIF